MKNRRANGTQHPVRGFLTSDCNAVVVTAIFYNDYEFVSGFAAIMRAVGLIERQLRTLMAARLGAQEADIDEETSLITDLVADSLDLVSLIIDIEAEFGIDIPDEDAMQIKTVRQLMDYVSCAAAVQDIGAEGERQIPMSVRRH